MPPVFAKREHYVELRAVAWALIRIKVGHFRPPRTVSAGSGQSRFQPQSRLAGIYNDLRSNFGGRQADHQDGHARRSRSTRDQRRCAQSAGAYSERPTGAAIDVSVAASVGSKNPRKRQYLIEINTRATRSRHTISSMRNP